MKELALQVTTDPDQKFELALALDDLDRALEITESAGAKQGGTELKWRTLGDRALALWKIDLAARCFSNAGDLAALLLVYSSTGDREGMKSLAEQASGCLHISSCCNMRLTTFIAESKGLNNIAFSALLQLQDAVGCVDLLMATERIPEAALFARTYAPSQTSRVVKAWKADLESKKRAKIAAGIADPEDGAELFEDWSEALSAEQHGGVKQELEQDHVGVDDATDLVQQLHLSTSCRCSLLSSTSTDCLRCLEDNVGPTRANGHYDDAQAVYHTSTMTNGSYATSPPAGVPQSFSQENEDLLA